MARLPDGGWRAGRGDAVKAPGVGEPALPVWSADNFAKGEIWESPKKTRYLVSGSFVGGKAFLVKLDGTRVTNKRVQRSWDAVQGWTRETDGEPLTQSNPETKAHILIGKITSLERDVEATLQDLAREIQAIPPSADDNEWGASGAIKALETAHANIGLCLKYSNELFFPEETDGKDEN